MQLRTSTDLKLKFRETPFVNNIFSHLNRFKYYTEHNADIVILWPQFYKDL